MRAEERTEVRRRAHRERQREVVRFFCQHREGGRVIAVRTTVILKLFSTQIAEILNFRVLLQPMLNLKEFLSIIQPVVKYYVLDR